MSPLFDLPLFTFKNICIDILHACDLGVTQDIVGNILFLALGIVFLGSNRKHQMDSLNLQLKDHYRVFKTKNRVGFVSEDMVKRSGKSPKFRAKGAETRHIVPFCLIVAKKFHEIVNDDMSMTMVRLMTSLMDFYMCLGHSPFPYDEFKSAGQKIVLFFTALRSEAESRGKDLWKLKPKLHLLLEMTQYTAEETGDPGLYWTYADEDFVGMVSAIGESRGGPDRATTTPTRVARRIRILMK